MLNPPAGVQSKRDRSFWQSTSVIGGSMANPIRESPNLLIDTIPWPAALISESGRVLRMNALMQARGVPLAPRRTRHIKSVFPEYVDALRGDPCWRVAQEVATSRPTPTGTVFEHIWIRPFGARSLLIAVDETRLHDLESGYAQNARLASLGFLLASVSHEINNPLSVISSMVQILESKRGVSDEVRQRGASLIAENSRRLLLITRKLTSFARVADTMAKPFSIDTAIDEAFLQVRHDSLGESVRFDHQRDPRAIVLGYQDQIQQVFFNLFLNSAQAMKGHGTISVMTDRGTSGALSVMVSDTGPGIPSTNVGRIFEPFFTTKASGEGVGLGLAICNEILQEHRGTLTVKAGTVGGAAFQVTLPLAPDVIVDAS
jgi:signal transduction histidine kinase